MRPGPRARGRVALAVLTLLLVGGCGGLPATSPVLPGRRVDDNVAPPVHVVVPPPAKDASPDQVARDFIRAGAAFQESDDNQQIVGKAYLAPGSVERWRPTSSVVVFDVKTALSVEPMPGNQIRLRTVAVATLDETGHYRENPPGTIVSVVFAMTKVDGQWRIELPESGFGMWLKSDDFDQLFTPFRIHYVSSPEHRLVADVRWFPPGPRLASALARAQLEAVPDYLRGAVETGIPEGTKLAVDAVAVQDGVATVTLNGSGQSGDPGRRRAMWAQFVATLTQPATGVAAVSLEVQYVGKIPVPSLSATISSVGDLGYAPEVVPPPTRGILRSAEGLTLIDPRQVDDLGARGKQSAQQPPVQDLPTVPPGYTDLAMSPDGSDLAAVGGDLRELSRWHGTTQVRVPAFGSALTKPSYDVRGRLWVAGVADRTARIWTFDTTSAEATPPVPVDVPWLSGRVVVNLRVSPDGTRVAVISRLPGEQDYRLDIAGVVRTAGAEPASLAAPYRQGEPLRRYLDVVWLDQTTMAVLGRVLDADPIRPFIVDVGQGVGLRRRGQLDPAQTLVAPVKDAVSLTTTGGARGLVVTTSAPAVMVRVGSAWVKLPTGTELAVAGV